MKCDKNLKPLENGAKCNKHSIYDKSIEANPVIASTNNNFFYFELLKKFMFHVTYHEGMTYTSESYINSSDVVFTAEEIKILQDIADKI